MKILFVFVFFIFDALVYAYSYRTQPTQIIEKVFGDSCRSLTRRNQSLPCNPAFTAQDQPGQFSGQVFGGHNFTYVEEARELLNNEANDTAVNKLFSQEKTAEAFSTFEVSYSASKWGIGFTPTQIYVSTWFRNQALPQLRLFAVQERSFRFQLASYLDKNWSFGAQLKMVDRKFVAKDILATEVLFSAQDLMKPETQQSVYIEPGFSFENPEAGWHPQFSISAHQFGFNDKDSDNLKIKPELNAGFSLQPPIATRTEFGLNVRTPQEDEDWNDRLRLAGSLRLDNLEFLGGVSNVDYDLGIINTVGVAQVGVSYSVNKMPWDRRIESYQTNVQFGFVY